MRCSARCQEERKLHLTKMVKMYGCNENMNSGYNLLKSFIDKHSCDTKYVYYTGLGCQETEDVSNF